MVYLQNKIFQASFQFANHNDKTNVFDPFTETTERLYILLGQLALKKKKNSTDLYSVEISAPNNETIKFSQATNQRRKDMAISWCYK